VLYLRWRTIPRRRTKLTEEQQKRWQDGCSEFQLPNGKKTQGEEEEEEEFFFFFS
jgi:hypothetical protein